MPALFPEKVSFSLGYPLLGLIVSFPCLLLEHWPAGNVDGPPSAVALCPRGKKEASVKRACAYTHFFFNLGSRV